ncbi:MAG: DUF1822 family protein [Leptolyngbyaceae cyanobacterium bins.349]|nr:DUF1822 family protein [Leptolyngbyaceae cyanobacterium bins.349]
MGYTLHKLIDSVCSVEVHGFTICLIAVEHVLDETVRIPQVAIDQPELAAHFYVVGEVSEEQDLLTLRGLCRYDELIRDRHHDQIQQGDYLLPLAQLDAELNHLVFYCRSLQPAAIPLPTNTVAPIIDQFFVALATKTTT